MKTKLFTVAIAMGLTMATRAQTTFFSGFENWGTSTTFTASASVPTDWMGSKTTTSIVVSQVTTGAEEGNSALNIVNTSTTTAVRLTTQPVAITQGTTYLISFYAKGKGSIRTGLYSGKTTNSGGGYTPYGTYESVSSSTNWYKYSQSVIADTTNGTTAQFILSVKSTGTSGSITGLDIDSVYITPYVIQNVNLHDIQYTTASNGYSPFYGKYVNTGGIVTAKYSSGYYIQNTGSSAWAGALVFSTATASNVAVGDSLTLTTSIDEYYAGGSTMTELGNVTNFVKVSSGNTLPAPVVITTNALNETAGNLLAAEQYEGILVSVQNATCATYTASYGQGTVNDGSGATQVDKQLYTYHFQVNQTYTVTGPVDYNYGYNIEPRSIADIDSAAAATGISTHNALQAHVYPNPVANELTIQLPFNAEKINVSVIDMLGREVMTAAPASGTNVSVQNMNLPAGMYLVKIVADNKQQLVKITKQ